MTLVRYLNGKSGEQYEFAFHSIGRELASGPGIYALFSLTTDEAVAASKLYGDGSPATGDDSGQPVRITASDNLAGDLGPTFIQGGAVADWQAAGGASVYIWRANSLASRDAALLDLWGSVPRPEY